MNSRQIAQAAVPQVIPTARRRYRHIAFVLIVMLSIASAAILANAMSTRAVADAELSQAEQLAFDAGIQVGREEMAVLAAAAYEQGRSDALKQAAVRP